MSQTAEFFGGAGSNLGSVSRLPVATFADFVKETLGHPALLHMTKGEFLAMPKEKKDRAKRVAYFTPAAFYTSPCARLTENATRCYLAALDIDDARQAGPLYRNPDRIGQALEPYGYAVYTSASSTPEAPRLRVVVALEGVSVAQYPQAVAAITLRLGLPEVTRESTVAVQPMFLPTMFRDEDPIQHHPLIVAAPDGLPFPTELCTADLPEREKLPSNDDPAADDLDFLRSPVDSVDFADVEKAISYLDPDCHYSDWIDVAAALRHQYPHDPELTRAFDLFDSWSALGSKYVSRDDTLAKWRSFKPHPKGRAPITIRTLLHRAREAGWNATTAAAKSYAAVDEWLSDPTLTPNALLSEGVRRIVAAPLLSPLERGALLSKLQERLRKCGIKVNRGDLKKEMEHLERAARGSTDGEVRAIPEKQLPPWAKGICYVAGANQFYQRATDLAIKPEVLCNLFNVHLMGAEEKKNGKPVITAQDFLLNVARIPRVTHYLYDPSRPTEAFVSEDRKKWVNTYRPCYPEADPTDAEKVGALLWQHVRNLIAEPELQQTVVDWLAYHVQHPGGKIHWAILLQGVHGCGKTLLADLLRAALGKPNVKSVEATVLLNSAWNDWAVGAQVVALEEVRVIGHNRHEVMNRLKPLITNSVVAVSRRFQDLVQAPNCTNYLMFTNHTDALAVTDGERRYLVIRSALQDKAQLEALGGKSYFDALYDIILHKPGAVRYWLENWTISADFKPHGHAPATPYLAELVRATQTPLQAAVSDILDDQESPLVSRDLVSMKVLRDLIGVRDRTISVTDQSLAHVMREMGFVAQGRARIMGVRHPIWAHRESCYKGQNFVELAVKLASQESLGDLA